MKSFLRRYRRAGTALLLALIMAIAPFTSALAASATYKVSTSKINLRKTPNMDSGIIQTIREGEEVTLISSTADGWLQVSYGGKTGYVSSEYVTLESITGSMIGTVIKAEKLNIRQTASSKAKVLKIAPLGATLTVDRIENGFFHVIYDGTEGYVSSEYILLSVITSQVEVLGPQEEEQIVVPAQPAETETSDTLRKGDSGSAVKALQQQLIELGYLTGTADGDYGASTEAAVKAFQRVQGLTVDGDAGAKTLAAISAAIAAARNSTLKKGDKGDQVKALQQQLIALGYLSGSADGVFGSATLSAIKAFQKAKGLSQTGEADVATQSAINTAYIASQNASGSSALKKGDKGDAIKALQQQLIKLGYLNGSADGAFGSATQSAVKAFQKANGLTQTGEADQTTQLKINLAVAALTQSPVTTTLKKGDNGEAVKALQQQLIKLGYLSGTADGDFGAATKAAVRAFQKNVGLSDDGVAGEKTLDAIAEAVEKCVETNVQQNTVTLVLKKGDKGEAVKALQTSLVKLGYLTGTADGIYGTATLTAVKAFQAANGLTSDGVAGGSTLTKLEAAVSKPGSVVSTSLKKGASGDEVKAMQASLIKLGYLTGKADGVFGAATENAVKAFQKAYNLTADGVAGSKTLALIASAVEANAPAQPTAGPGTSTGTLQKGSTGTAVKALQTRLSELGYLLGGVDGEYGALTERAVMAFQENNKLTATGIADSKTISVLNSKAAIEAKAPVVTTKSLAQEIIATAKQYLGCPYVYATRGPKTFDCSGFTYFVFKQYGFSLGNSAYNQGYDNRYTKISSITALQPGDLVYFDTIADSDLSDHAGIYIGDGNFIHASSGGGHVMISTLLTGYYYTRFSWGRRVLT